MHSEKILIIDDSIAIASLLANEILPLGGYEATAALSGEEGLELARKINPALILCDLEMPDINGLDVLRTLKDEGIQIPSIMMTAFGSEAIAAQALRMGVKDYIIKPFTTEEMLAAVERALAENRLRNQLEKTTDELEEYQQVMVVLQTVSQAVASGLKPASFLSRVILAAVYSQGAQGGFIARLETGENDQEKQLVIQAAVNLPKWEGQRIKIRETGALHTALNHNQISKNIDKSGCWHYAPLMRNQIPVGMMATISVQETIPAHIEHLFSTLAGYAAFAVENNRLQSQLGQQKEAG